mmetsp:Transcript_19811/g.49873  ORF Transcript_19811/g.49873 Transcript_19811/m.49873 type:complete len:116 (-) Transcript_19811:473-820(-)
MIDQLPTTVVLKEFKHCGEGQRKYLKQIEVSNIASFLAREYNLRAKPANYASIDFLKSHVVTVNANEGMSAEIPCASAWSTSCPGPSPSTATTPVSGTSPALMPPWQSCTLGRTS